MPKEQKITSADGLDAAGWALKLLARQTAKGGGKVLGNAGISAMSSQGKAGAVLAFVMIGIGAVSGLASGAVSAVTREIHNSEEEKNIISKLNAVDDVDALRLDILTRYKPSWRATSTSKALYDELKKGGDCKLAIQGYMSKDRNRGKAMFNTVLRSIESNQEPRSSIRPGM